LIVLGINAYHGDSAAAVVRDGELIAAAEEERFRRVKHWAGFPTQALAYCLKEAKVNLSEVSHIALNQDNRANFLRKVIYFAVRRPSIGLVLRRLANRRKREGLPAVLRKEFPDRHFRGEFHHVEHHLAHLSSAFHVSHSKRRLSFPLTALVISRARLGVWHAAAKSGSKDEYFFPTHSGFSIRQLLNTSGFRIMVTSIR
jgi:predicted NodU family carbamoyl transferase